MCLSAQYPNYPTTDTHTHTPGRSLSPTHTRRYACALQRNTPTTLPPNRLPCLPAARPSRLYTFMETATPKTAIRMTRYACCSVLQRIAACCSVLQYFVVCCSVLQCVAVCCSVLQCVEVCCSVLQCVAECCSVVQCVAVRGSVWQFVALCCSVLQCAAVYYSVLHCVAVCCSIL